MALSGTINGSVTNKSSYFSFYMTWSATQSVSGNYSDVTVNTYWKTTSTSHRFDTVGNRTASITINGTTTSVTKRFNCDPWPSNPFLIHTQTTRVYHNNDGTKSITISARANGGASTWGPSSSSASSADCTASGTITLNTIPRASSFGTITGNTIGASMTVNIVRNSSSFTHKLWYKLGNSGWSNEYAFTGTSVTFTISNSLLSQLSTATSGTLQLCIGTYSGSTLIGGYVYKDVTVYASSDVQPTVGTITLTPQTYSSLIQNKNKLTISVSGCTAGTGSTIKSYTFSGPGISSTTTNTSVTTGVISNTGKLIYTVTVTDNRGRTASETAEIECCAWLAPTIKLSAFRVTSNTATTANPSGTYVRCSYNIGFSPVNNTNDVTIKLYFKKSSASSWSSVDVVTDSKDTSGTYYLSSFDIGSTYSVYATVTDNYGGSINSNQVTIFSAERVMNVRPQGKGIAFGKMADTDNVLDSKWPIKTQGLYVETKPVSLYSSTSGGASGNVTLSESAVNYEYLEIYYADSTGTASPQSIRVCSPNNKTVDLVCIGAPTTESAISMVVSRYTIVGNILTFVRSKSAAIKHNTNASVTESTSTNHIRILRVLGYN